MKFNGEPNLLVRITKPKRGEVKHFTFDENGVYETEHPFTIQRLKASFEAIGEESNVIDEEIEVKTEDVQEEVIQAKQKHCRKCEFACDTKGELLNHYRSEHKKEGA